MVLAAVGVTFLTPVWADQPQYLRGYLNALMDTRFPGLGLRVRKLDSAGQVTLYSETCLGPWQRRDIAQTIQDTGRVTAVQWDRRADCAQEAAPGASADEELAFDVQALPEQVLFAPLLADPRQPRFSMSYQRYRILGETFNAGSVAFGEYFGLASGFLGANGSSQVGLQGAVFALFNLDAASNDLVNADYWIGIPITYRYGRWSYLLRLYHQSSHLGDEFILGNPGIARVNLSYEDLEGLVSYEWEYARLYGGGGTLLASEPALARPHARLGFEFIRPGIAHDIDLLSGVDIQGSEELDWELSRSFQLGLGLRKSGNRRVRLMLEYFRGHSPNGQFFREHVRYSGVGLYFGF